MPESKSIKQKVVVYCVKDDKLLVFRHSDFSYEEVGIQVPAGSIKEGELPADAALRELQEETGKECFEIVKFLGTGAYDMTPTYRGIKERHFFLARPTGELPERWESEEKHDGNQAPTHFKCFWIPLTRGHILESGMGAMLYKIFE